MISTIVDQIRWLIRGRSSTAAVMQTTVFQVITLVANLATGILTARLLAPAGRGELAAINLIPAVMGYLLTLGVPAALLYELKREPAQTSRLVGAAFAIISILGLAAIGVGYVVMPYTLHQYSPDVVQLARLFMFTTPLALFSFICTSVFDSAGNFWYSNATRFLSPIVTLLSLCAFSITGHLNVLTAAASYTIPALPIGIKMIADVVRMTKPTLLPWSLAPSKSLLSYGLRSFGVDLLRTIGAQIDQLLVVAFLTPAAMGLYAVALALSRVLQLFQTSVVRVLLPRIAARPADEVVPAVARATRITAALTAPLCAGVIVLTPALLGLAYGGKFTGATAVLRVLAVEALFTGATWILAQAFLALGKPGIVTALQAIGLALSFPLMIVLIPRFGLLGAGLSLLVSTLVRFGLVLACFPWLLKTAPPHLLLTGDDVRSLRNRFRPAAPEAINDSVA